MRLSDPGETLPCLHWAGGLVETVPMPLAERPEKPERQAYCPPGPTFRPWFGWMVMALAVLSVGCTAVALAVG